MLSSDYIARRQQLYSLLPPSSIAVVYSRDTLQRSATIPYHFDQFSDFLYLTGHNRPGGALALYTLNGSPHSALFLPPRDPNIEMFEGRRSSFESAQRISGVDSVRPLSEFLGWISRHISENSPNVFASLPPHQSSPHGFRLLSPYIDQLRVIKSDKEVRLIKRACEITKSSFAKVMKSVKSGDTERMIAARFEYEAVAQGATGLAYPVECQAGDNALYLHYIENAATIKKGDCVMLDAGCEFEGYASDFARTFPVGRVGSAKLAALKIVENCKDELVAMAKSGKLSCLDELNMKAQEMLLKGLKELGVKASMTNLEKYFPHRISHYIGLDVHDCKTIGGKFKLRKGCAFSVEPGLYFQHDSDCPSELKGLGIRFEDTVIIE